MSEDVLKNSQKLSVDGLSATEKAHWAGELQENKVADAEDCSKEKPVRNPPKCVRQRHRRVRFPRRGLRKR